MVFTSLTFLIFAVILFFVYYLVPKKGQWIVLLVGSLIFYLFSGWKYFIFLISTIVCFYLLGLLLGKVSNKEEKLIECKKNETEDKETFKAERNKIRAKSNTLRKLICALGIVLALAALFFVKYFNFFGTIFTSIFLKNKTFIGLDLIVPLGLSFYLFSSIGYLIDISRGVHGPEKNIFKFALFVSFFPVVLQGPICTYSELSNELYLGHELKSENISNGFRRVLLGFVKKILIADLLGVAVSTVFSNSGEYHGFIILLTIIFYAIQLYADFSGYMDIAIGFAEMLGIKLPENFDNPYMSHSISEFWRRWHITLGAWFRNYLYYPLLRSKGLNKTKNGLAKLNKKFAEKFVTIIALAIVWISIGLWHGASFNYVLYGCFHGFFVICDVALSDIYKKIKKLLHIKDSSKLFKAFQIIRTFLIVCLGYTLFRASSLSQTGYMIKESIRFWDWQQIINGTLFNLGIHWSIYIVVLVFILFTIFGNSFFRKVSVSSRFNIQTKTPIVAQYAVLVILCWAVIAGYIYTKSLGEIGSSFIYFEF